jgi:hypothetical protein
MKLLHKSGVTGVILRVKILDSASTTGAGKTGLADNSAGLVISTIASNEAAPTAYSQAAGTIETIATLGTFAAPTAGKCRFKEVDAANHPGLYEIQLPNERFAVAGASGLIVSLSGASGAAQCDAEVQLAAVDTADVRDLVEADRVIDTTVSPWALVLIKKGTGALGAPGAVELVRQKLYDVTGGGVTNASTILGRSIT